MPIRNINNIKIEKKMIVKVKTFSGETLYIPEEDYLDEVMYSGEKMSKEERRERIAHALKKGGKAALITTGIGAAAGGAIGAGTAGTAGALIGRELGGSKGALTGGLSAGLAGGLGGAISGGRAALLPAALVGAGYGTYRYFKPAKDKKGKKKN